MADHRRGLVAGTLAAVLCLGSAVARAQQPAPPLRTAVAAIADAIEREYFDPAVATATAGALRARAAAGAYDGARSDEALAATLTADLLARTHDRHLAVAVVHAASPAVANATGDETRALAVRRANAGVERVAVLPGNIGLVALTHFFRLSEARATVAAAMTVVAHADALILDLRDNGGGSPDTVALLASYLFDRPALPLFAIEARTGETTTFATEATVPEDADARRPVFVLTSTRTFSAGEGAAFLLHARGRAVVIGEATPGAANPGRPYPVAGRFEVTIPNGRVRVAPRGDNWEGTGVVPDVPVPADEALRAAQVRALQILVDRAPAGAWQQSLRAALDRLGAAPH